MVTVTGTAKSTKDIKTDTNTADFCTTSDTYVDVTGMSIASVLDNSVIGFCGSCQNGSASSDMKVRLSEATPSSTWAEYTTTQNSAEKMVSTDNQDAGSTQTVDMQARRFNGAGTATVHGTTAQHMRMFAMDGGFVLGVADVTIEHTLPIKISIDAFDMTVLASGQDGAGFINGIGGNSSGIDVPVIHTLTMDNVVTDGLHFIADTEIITSLVTGNKVCLLFDFTGTKIEVTP